MNRLYLLSLCYTFLFLSCISIKPEQKITQLTEEEAVILRAIDIQRREHYNRSLHALPTSLQTIDPNFNEEISANLLNVTRLVNKTPALVVSTVNETLSGLSTIDGVTLATNDRVLLVAQTSAVENGLWLAQSGSWTRPADFATSALADQAYVLILSGSTNAGSSWLCTTPTAVIDTDPISFDLFGLPDVIVGTNVGGGTGLIFRDKTGTSLNFKSLNAGSGIIVTNNTDTITIDASETSTNAPNTIVARDGSGSFSAGVVSVTDSIISNTLTITPFNSVGIVHNDVSGLFSSSLIVNADISSSAAITDSKLATINTAGKVSNSATTANATNLANAIVARDGLGNFSAGTITANLSGNATTASSATTATSATDFTGSLIGDVTGTQGATTVGFVGGQSATNIANATVLTNSSTSANTANAIIRRDATGRFSAGIISVTDSVISNTLTVIPLNVAGVVHNSSSGLLSTSLIVNADISSSAAIADSKLATISSAGKVTNSATTASSVNSANTIVSRDASGNFSSGTIVATLQGTALNNVLKSGDTMTGTLQLPAGTSASPSLTFTGSTTTGLSATASNLVINTNGSERMRVSSGGVVSIKGFTTAGIVKNDALGNLSSGLIVDSNISSSAGIIDTKLTTISTSGKVANSATTATSLATANAIVSRDSLGNFNANGLTVVDAVATGNFILSTDPSTSTAGNIVKGTTPFIHNYGTNNTFIGISTGNFTMTGTENTAVGALALTTPTSGSSNTAIGFNSLPECTTGNSNIAIGSSAGTTVTTGSGNIYINANAAASNEATTIRMGTSQTRCFIAGIRGRTTGNANAIAVLIDSAGQLGTVSSSIQYKKNVRSITKESSRIMKLRPVIFAYKNDSLKTTQFGLIAEEVDEIFPEIVVKNDKGEPETVQYHILPVLILNEVIKQQRQIKKQEAIIQEQTTLLGRMEFTIETMRQAIRSLEEKIKIFNQIQ